MKKIIFQFILLCFPLLLVSQNTEASFKERITSVIDSTHSQNMILKQSFIVNVPLDSVWRAYTTKKGWESWATAIAEIDFKINGVIKTNYNKNGKISDDTTITLHIVNYIPKRMLTLQAELTKNFPEFMKRDAKNLFNTILFDEITPHRTQVTSYGIGYKNNEKYRSLMTFFIQGNEKSYINLMSYLETGKLSTE